MDRLVVLSDLARVGEVIRRRNGVIQFTYADDWRRRTGAFPLSCQVPLTRASPHPQEKLLPWLRGLVGKKNADGTRLFDLLSQRGDDLPGGVRFVPLHRATEGTTGRGVKDGREDNLTRCDDAAFSAHLDALISAQGTTALYRDDRGWAVPQPPIPTTHILKGFSCPERAENEHFCLHLARLSGLDTVTSQIIRPGVLVVERFDRFETAFGLLRLHHESLYQAMGLRHTCARKGGPDAIALYRLIQSVSDNPADPESFLKVLAFHWAIGGATNPADHLALLHTGAGETLLGSLSAVCSVAPAQDIADRRLRLRIGGKAKVGRIKRRHWHKLGAAINQTERAMDDLLSRFLDNVMIALHSDDFDRELGVWDHPSALREVLIDHVKGCQKEFKT